MSAYRDSLTPEQQVVYDRCCAEAAFVIARARARRDSLPVMEAAREAYIPGGPSVEEIAEIIRSHREEARAALNARSLP
ncbi:hypothetical protein HS048_34330 [Planomonospora sp. ID91781]|uniref:hypothetical protein n=1 Tax=Planomonospora sp. ID91781 TaxID=2738135 RepID=UPI0018C3ECB7|nr:hypothetical protein [Planomonospora sp. ID91781]MBG0825764.1 hypothetical protein [Planomonospora sp. ID91781]